VEVLATRLLTVLCERGYEVVVVTSKQSPEQPAEAHYQGIPVYRFAFPGNASSAEQLAAEFMRIKQQISKLKRRFAPDLVHINAGGLGEFFTSLPLMRTRLRCWLRCMENGPQEITALRNVFWALPTGWSAVQALFLTKDDNWCRR
jgi:hypothetical protein